MSTTVLISRAGDAYRCEAWLEEWDRKHPHGSDAARSYAFEQWLEEELHEPRRREIEAEGRP